MTDKAGKSDAAVGKSKARGKPLTSLHYNNHSSAREHNPDMR
jgi:hypothetical protein